LAQAARPFARRFEAGSAQENRVTFERPWMLLFALLPVAWFVLRYRTVPRKIGFALKAAALTSILLAIAEPGLRMNSRRTAAVILVDTSGSVSAEDLEKASGLTRSIERAKGRNWLRVLSFAQSVRNLTSTEKARFELTAGDGGKATDIEAAIRSGIAALPSGMAQRIVLISDGKENAGSVARAAWQARELGIPIDTYALAGKPKPRLLLESVNVPGNAFTGERFPVDLTVTSPQRVSASVEISAEGKTLGAQTAELQEGKNTLRLHANINSAGALSLSGVIRAPELGPTGEARFDHAITLRKPGVLFVSQDPPGSGSQLLSALAAAQFNVTEAPAIPPGDLSRFQIVALNNQNLAAMPEDAQARLEGFVKDGGGLIVIGGEREVYVEKKTESPLDRALPAKIAPPRSPEGTCVVLIIDKSSSMEGKKIELARLAAIGVIRNLRPIDKIGVLIFDNSFQWAVPIRRAEDKVLINRLVAGITPDGGTQIAPALSEAYHKTLAQQATYKHIVLLTDGISEEGDSLELAREAEGQRVTISTVGLGQDVNRAYLEKIAASAGGKSYFLSDPAGLQQILLRDVLEHTGTTAVEKPLKVAVRTPAAILEGAGMDTAPELKGYVRFTAKPSAETILTVDERDPLLVRWRNGLGRATVFTSDAKSRWAANWIGWKGFDPFWANVFRDLLPEAAPEEAHVDYESATGELTVSYQLSGNVEEPKAVPDIFVFGPEGLERPVPVAKVSDGLYRGKVAIGRRQGLFRIRPLADSPAFPEVGFYREQQEERDYGSNESLLRGVSQFTGGRSEPPAQAVFDPAGRSFPVMVRFWPGLVALALLLNLVELLLRKGPGILAGLRGWRAQSA
jgi:Mg-chelatase subunit ChlD